MINKRRFLFMFLFCSPCLFVDGAAKADLFSKEQTNFLPVRCLAKVEPLFVPGLDRMVDSLDDLDSCRRLIMLSENCSAIAELHVTVYFLFFTYPFLLKVACILTPRWQVVKSG